MKKRPIMILISLCMACVLVLIPKKTENNDLRLNANISLWHNYRYHLVMITRATENVYWSQVLAGARETAAKEEGKLEYFGSRFLDLKELERYLEMAILSSVDGILVSLPNEETFKDLVNEATDLNIPLVFLYRDFETPKKHSFVGVDSYELGFKTGTALSTAVISKGPEETQVAVLINADFSITDRQLYLEGIKEAVKSDKNLIIQLVISTTGGSISAEEQTQTILKKYPGIKVIVCSDASDTIGVAKVVVDFNKVSQITIIGSGFNEEIYKYIKLKVIWGVLADDPYELGVQGMLALLRLKQGLSRQEVYHIPVRLVTYDNVEGFQKNQRESSGLFKGEADENRAHK